MVEKPSKKELTFESLVYLALIHLHQLAEREGDKEGSTALAIEAQKQYATLTDSDKQSLSVYLHKLALWLHAQHQLFMAQIKNGGNHEESF